jgi:integrase
MHVIWEITDEQVSHCLQNDSNIAGTCCRSSGIARLRRSIGRDACVSRHGPPATIALIANSFDVKWVMAQVGHADSRMTMDVYAQLAQRAKREHGASFDRLVRQAAQARGE